MTVRLASIGGTRPSFMRMAAQEIQRDLRFNASLNNTRVEEKPGGAKKKGAARPRLYAS